MALARSARASRRASSPRPSRCPLAAQPTSVAANLADLSLEQLGNIVVTSVSRREEPLAEAPASIYVITAEDIRRSGATSLPEALRLAPNLQVARADANQYAISARGFNNVLANKLLVLIDGRTVYTPLFSGVFWEAQDVMLEDIERIEVISGPGGDAVGRERGQRRHQHHHAAARARRRARSSPAAPATARRAAPRATAATLPSGGHYRVYAQVLSTATNSRARERRARSRDASQRGQAGFRADWAGAGRQRSRCRATPTAATIDQAPSSARSPARTCSAAGRASSTTARASRVQAYYDRTDRDHPQLVRGAARHVRPRGAARLHALGRARAPVGRRLSPRARPRRELAPRRRSCPPDSDARAGPTSSCRTRSRCATTVDLTLGAKVEHNAYTGAECLPSVRLAWQPTPTQHAVGGAVARGARAVAHRPRVLRPRRAAVRARRHRHFESEVANVLELGYRAQPTPALSYSVTRLPPRLRAAAQRRHRRPAAPMFANDDRGHARRGVEAWGTLARAADAGGCPAGVVALHERLAGRARRRRPRRLGRARQRSRRAVAAALDARPRAANQELDVVGAPRRRAAEPDGAGLHRGRRAARLARDAAARAVARRPEPARPAPRRMGQPAPREFERSVFAASVSTGRP